MVTVALRPGAAGKTGHAPPAWLRPALHPHPRHQAAGRPWLHETNFTPDEIGTKHVTCKEAAKQGFDGPPRMAQKLDEL